MSSVMARMDSSFVMLRTIHGIFANPASSLEMCIRDRRPFPFLGKGAALEDIPPPLAGEIAQPGQTVKGEPRCV